MAAAGVDCIEHGFAIDAGVARTMAANDVGLRATRRFAPGAVFVFQLTLPYRFHAGLDLRLGLGTPQSCLRFMSSRPSVD